jgi:hypothetical protein
VQESGLHTLHGFVGGSYRRFADLILALYRVIVDGFFDCTWRRWGQLRYICGGWNACAQMECCDGYSNSDDIGRKAARRGGSLSVRGRLRMRGTYDQQFCLSFLCTRELLFLLLMFGEATTIPNGVGRTSLC